MLSSTSPRGCATRLSSDNPSLVVYPLGACSRIRSHLTLCHITRAPMTRLAQRDLFRIELLSTPIGERADERVASNACVACLPGTTNDPDDDSSGADTSCEVTLCALDEHVVDHVCVACPEGSTNDVGDDAP